MPSDLILYDRCRPSYPPAAWQAAEHICGLPPGAVVADVGSGSGIFTEQLLRSRYEVHAVEPLAVMRSLAMARLVQHPAYRSVPGSAEDTGLPTDSVDVVTAASALHWFAPDTAGAEFRRILREPKWLVALWNFRAIGGSAFSRAFDQLWRDHLGPPPAGTRDKIEDEIVPLFFSLRQLHRRSFDNPLPCTETQILGLVLSSSNAPAEDDPKRAELERAVRDLHRRYRHAGTVAVSYETVLYCGRLA